MKFFSEMLYISKSESLYLVLETQEYQKYVIVGLLVVSLPRIEIIVIQAFSLSKFNPTCFEVEPEAN